MVSVLGNQLVVAIIAGLIVAVAGGYALHRLLEYKSEKTSKTAVWAAINNADSLLKTGLIEDALEIYVEMSTEVSEAKDPEACSRIKNGEGLCYSKLAEIGNKEDNLRKAIRAYEEGLKILTVEKYPSYYELVISDMERAEQMMRE